MKNTHTISIHRKGAFTISVHPNCEMFYGVAVNSEHYRITNLYRTAKEARLAAERLAKR